MSSVFSVVVGPLKNALNKNSDKKQKFARFVVYRVTSGDALIDPILIIILTRQNMAQFLDSTNICPGTTAIKAGDVTMLMVAI